MYVPVVSTMVNSLGQVPCNKLNTSRCFVLPESENLQMLKTKVPDEFAEENGLDCAWEPVAIHRRFLRPNQPPKKR